MEPSKAARSFRIFRATARLGFAVAVAMAAGTALAQSLPELQITAPSDGTVVVPGQILMISVQSPAAVSFPNGVAIIGSNPLGGAGPVAALPYTFSLTIPANTNPGAYGLTAFGVDSTGVLAESSVTLQIEPANAPVLISVQPAQAVLAAIGSSVSVHVKATFADSSTADVTESANLSFLSAAPTVATVDAERAADGHR
jgi:hypothetical protein